MKPVRTISILITVLLLFIAAGCGGGDNKSSNTTSTTPTSATTTGGSEAGGAKTVDLNEYSIDPGSLNVAKGTKLTVKNVGNIAHNLTIEQGSDPKKASKKLEGTSTFLGGKSEDLTVDLKPGKYAMACTVPGHRELGMVGTITVK
jgi:uncharacterized cupredoxin-like copper-binding protein